MCFADVATIRVYGNDVEVVAAGTRGDVDR